MADKQISVFRSATESLQFIFKNGARAVFVGGKFATDNPVFAAELQAEIDAGNQELMQGTEDDKLVAEAKGDVMEALRAKFYKQFEDEQARKAAELEKGKDQGTAPAAVLVPANSKTIAAVTANQAKQ